MKITTVTTHQSLLSLLLILLLSTHYITLTSAGHSKGGKGSGRKKWCRDNTKLTFDTENSGVADCEWLSEKPSRQEKYCETKGWDNTSHKKIKFICRASCALYLDNFDYYCDDEIEDRLDELEDDDSVRQDENERNCEDEDDYVFSTEFSGEQDCAWLDESYSRKEKYCEIPGWDYDADKKVKFGCKAACVDYLGNFECEKSKKNWCEDEEDFEFETEWVGTKDCDWLASNKVRQEKYCENRGYDNSLTKKIKFGCKMACSDYNRCGTEAPSIAPSIAPSATVSTDEWCEDEDDFTFEGEFAGEVDCEWLSMKEERQEKFCESRGYGGNNPSKKLVKYGCRKTCSEYNKCSS